MKWESKGKRKVFSFKRLGKSFVYAVKGIITAFKTEQNLWVDLLGMIIAIILGIWLKISNTEFCIILLSIGCCFFFEMMNTALEYTVDMAMPNIHPLAKCAKDISSGAVLIGDLFALISALIIFIPKIINILK